MNEETLLTLYKYRDHLRIISGNELAPRLPRNMCVRVCACVRVADAGTDIHTFNTCTQIRK